MDRIASIREEIIRELPLWDQPSIAVGIVKDGEVVLNEGFGWADQAKGLKANAETLYQIGSCSKAFTAAAAAVLVDQGKIAWDTPVREYLPWIRFQDPYVTSHVTMRDLLCHRTGLPRHDAYWIDGPCTRREMVENLRNMQPCWSMRSMWCYQNTCYVAAGMVIEAVSGMSWEDFVQKYLLDPIGMKRTYFYIDDIAADANHAAPYARHLPTDLHGYEEIPYLKSDREDKAAGIGAPYGPAGSIISTINDMLKWVSCLLNKGKAGDTQVISEAGVAELTRPQMLMSSPLLAPLPEEDFYSYGMGWFTETYRGHRRAEHGGNINGFSALVTLMPDCGLGVVALTNFNNSFNTYATTHAILDQYLNAEGGDWHNRYRQLIEQVFTAELEKMKNPEIKRVEGTSPSHALAAYAGTYRNATYGDIVISSEADGLHFLYNKAASPLEHFHFDSFRVTDPNHLFVGMLLSFLTNQKGEVDRISFGIVLNPEAKDEIFTRV
ncbi:MAG: serine hydrolase [Clostridiales bacterium]|nr:serine hydrolase [Clostridiales bacterium]